MFAAPAHGAEQCAIYSNMFAASAHGTEYEKKKQI